jgi:hypothetical protein
VSSEAAKHNAVNNPTEEKPLNLAYNSPAIHEPSVAPVYMVEFAKLEIVPRIAGFNEINSPIMRGKMTPKIAKIKKRKPERVETDEICGRTI